MATSPLWKEEYLLNIQEIDEQHRHFFTLINDLHLVSLQSITEREALLSLTRLADYAFYHFDTEEQLFDQCKYEGAEAHHAFHEAYRKRTKEYVERAREKGVNLGALVSEAAEYARHWLEEHIMVQDKKYVKVLREKGIF
jgi:hemerythrin